MNILEKYISKKIVISFIMTVTLLILVKFFIVLARDLSHIGKFHYILSNAIFYDLSQLPRFVIQALSDCWVIACAACMYQLKSHSEIKAMRCHGFGFNRLLRLIIIIVFAISCSICISYECFFKDVAKEGAQFREQQLGKAQIAVNTNPIWFKSRRKIIQIENIFSDRNIGNIHQYQFDKLHELKKVIYSRGGNLVNNHWVLSGNTVYDFSQSNNKINRTSSNGLVFDINLPSSIFLMGIKTTKLSIFDIYKLSNLQHLSESQKKIYAIVFWQKLFNPLMATVLVVFVCYLLVIYKPIEKGSSMIWTAILIALIFHFLSKVLLPIGALSAIPAWMVAIAPVCILGIAIASVADMRRT